MKKRYFMIGFLAILLIVGVQVGKKNTVKSADFSVRVENQSVKKDEEVTLVVTVKSSITIAKLEAYLKYDDRYLEFVSAREESVVGASGMLHIQEEFETPITEKEYAITMKALEVGRTSVTIENIYLEDEKNSDVIAINQTKASIEIKKNTEESSDAKLSSLLVFPGTLNQEFDPNVMEYNVSVEAEVEELIISAIPSMEDSVVTIDQPEQLKVGKNLVEIHVTSPAGTVKTYTIHVTKAAE